MLGKMGLRNQNNSKKIGINGSRIYYVTTLNLSSVFLFVGKNKLKLKYLIVVRK